MKERMITRTIESYEVTCLYANVKAMTMGECTLILPGSTPECKLDKEARKAFETSTVYGMSEADFIRHSKLLPPR